MVETVVILLVVFIVGSIAIKLLSGLFRIGIIVVLAVVLFGGGWATVAKWSDDAGTKAMEQVDRGKNALDAELDKQAKEEAREKRAEQKQKQKQKQKHQRQKNNRG